MGTFVENLFNGIVDSIKSAINIAISLINTAITAANKVPGVNFGTITPLSIAGTRADGGPVSSGQTYLVGERGPELFVPNGSGSIIPNNRIQSSGSSGNSPSITIQVTGNSFYGSDSSFAEKIGDEIFKKFNIHTAIPGF